MGSPHVLIASDRLDRCSHIIIALHELGARATLVAPGTAAVVAAGQLSPDLAVVDGDHKDGCRTVLSLGGIPALRRTLVLSDAPTVPRIDRCLIAGAADVLAWESSPYGLARLIVARMQPLSPDRARAIRQRRRDALGPAQQRVLEGLRNGMSCAEMADASGVSISAIYRARRTLARRLGMPTELLVDRVADDPVLADLMPES